MTEAGFDSTPRPVDTGQKEPTKSKSLFQPKDIFNIDQATENGKITSIERQISPYEKAYTIGDFSYIVWTEGPKTGSIYRVVASPTPEQLEKLKTVEVINAETLKKLEDIEKIEKDAEAVGKSSSWRLTDQGQDKLSEVAVDLHKLYYGDNKTIGIETAQLFDLNGEGKKYFDWIKRINPPEGKGYHAYLLSLAESHELPHVAEGVKKGIYQDIPALDQYFYGEITKRNRARVSPQAPVQLTHETHGNVLTNLVQLGVIAAPNYYKSHGIQKRFGGEMGDHRAYTPYDVSFWNSPSGQSEIRHGYVGKKGFEYPVVVGIDSNHARLLNLFEDSIGGAKRVRDYAHFTHLFVPTFKVAEVRGILQAHDMTEVEVLSLTGDA